MQVFETFHGMQFYQFKIVFFFRITNGKIIFKTRNMITHKCFLHFTTYHNNISAYNLRFVLAITMAMLV